MTGKLLVIVAIVLIAAGIIYTRNNTSNSSQTQNSENNTPVPTNSEALDVGGDYEVVFSEVDYHNGVKGYFVKPTKEGNYPGVVVVHENRGLQPETKQSAETLAKNGYIVLAVNLLGGIAEDQEGARGLTANFKQEEGTANMRAAAKYLRDHGATKIASLGWCFGGRQSLELSTSGETLDATVVYYGGGMPTTTDQLDPIKWPVLGVFGDKDQAIPVEKVKEFENSLNTLNIENEIHIYPGVGHAFANPSGANYAPNETKDAWEKTLDFLEKHLK